MASRAYKAVEEDLKKGDEDVQNQKNHGGRRVGRGKSRKLEDKSLGQSFSPFF